MADIKLKVKFFDFQIKKSKSEEMEVVPEESEAGEEGMVCSACDLKMWRSWLMMSHHWWPDHDVMMGVSTQYLDNYGLSAFRLE